MKRVWSSAAVGIMALSMAVLGFTKDEKAEPAPLTGTWDCMSHGGEQGDTPFTLVLEQSGEKVTGSVSSPQGGMEITSATFKNDVLEIHLDTPDGNYVLTATLKDGQLTSGQTSHDGNPEGKWEGKKAKKSGA
jgi:hypothetical protein